MPSQSEESVVSSSKCTSPFRYACDPRRSIRGFIKSNSGWKVNRGETYTSQMASIRIEEWHPIGDDGVVEMLATVLHAVVHDGASVGFILPFPIGEAHAYWTHRVLQDVRTRKRRLLLAWDGVEVVGTVHLNLDTMPNQAHRAEVSKLLVHPKSRRRGIARALMSNLEAIARTEGRTLLTLDTRSGDSAEPLYLSMGYTFVGAIPHFAHAPDSPAFDATSILYKEL
jgi:ribosomal protein S18 acetylase RimI-like enzyme